MEPAPSARPHGCAPVGTGAPIAAPVFVSSRTRSLSLKFETQIEPAAPRMPHGFVPTRTRRMPGAAALKLGAAVLDAARLAVGEAAGAAAGPPQLPARRRSVMAKTSRTVRKIVHDVNYRKSLPT